MNTSNQQEKPMQDSKDIKQETPLDKRRFLCLFAVYLIILLWIILFKCNQNERLCVEFQPFRSIWGHFLHGSIPFRSLYNAFLNYPGEVVVAILNFILFIPMGVAFPLLMSKKASLLSIFAVALGVELVQLFTGWGGYDITDVIITFFGGAFGVWIFQILRPRVSNSVVNQISYWGYLACSPFAFFVIFNTILHFPPIGITTLF